MASPPEGEAISVTTADPSGEATARWGQNLQKDSESNLAFEKTSLQAKISRGKGDVQELETNELRMGKLVSADAQSCRKRTEAEQGEDRKRRGFGGGTLRFVCFVITVFLGTNFEQRGIHERVLGVYENEQRRHTGPAQEAFAGYEKRRYQKQAETAQQISHSGQQNRGKENSTRQGTKKGGVLG